jgi:hypothetical protein
MLSPGTLESILEKSHLGKEYYSTYFLPMSLLWTLFALVYYYFSLPIPGLIYLGFQYLALEIYFTMFSKYREKSQNIYTVTSACGVNILFTGAMLITVVTSTILIEHTDNGKIQIIANWMCLPVYCYYTAFLYDLRKRYIAT